MLRHNLGNDDSYVRLTATLGLLPIITVGLFPLLSPFLRTLFWLVVPIWFVAHFSGTNATEAAVFLVPLTLVFIPAVLQAATVQARASAPQLNPSVSSGFDRAQIPELQEVGESRPR
jgi:hypothetical protein